MQECKRLPGCISVRVRISLETEISLMIKNLRMGLRDTLQN